MTSSYYGANGGGGSEKDESERFRLTTLDILINPLRSKHAFETWSPFDIAVFESAFCKYGKKFELIKRHLKSKSTKEIVDFYYAWKKTSHYKVWRNKFQASITHNQNDWIFKNSKFLN